jgi:hypothetical protein
MDFKHRRWRNQGKTSLERDDASSAAAKPMLKNDETLGRLSLHHQRHHAWGATPFLEVDSIRANRASGSSRDPTRGMRP